MCNDDEYTRFIFVFYNYMLLYEANGNERMALLEVLKKNHFCPFQLAHQVFKKEESETWEKLTWVGVLEMKFPSEDSKPQKTIGNLIINDTSTSNEFKATIKKEMWFWKKL